MRAAYFYQIKCIPQKWHTLVVYEVRSLTLNAEYHLYKGMGVTKQIACEYMRIYSEPHIFVDMTFTIIFHNSPSYRFFIL